VSNADVGYRRKVLILPIIGILLFVIGSYQSVRFNQNLSRKYYWWSAIRLDRDPLNHHPYSAPECNPETTNCGAELDFLWVDPGPGTRIFETSAAPAFLLGVFLTHLLGRFGISELLTFIIVMPLLIFAWYYFVAWASGRALNRWRSRSAAQGGLKRSL
jgi:hypothetical protein